MDKLLPCPFCGGKVEIDMLDSENSRNVKIYSAVHCPECHEWFFKGLSRGKTIERWNRRAQPENKPLTRCENCTHWDKSISFMMSAHACSYWSPSKSNPRYTAGFEFCSFAKAKPERSEGNGIC